jgi:hypothetical protein
VSAVAIKFSACRGAKGKSGPEARSTAVATAAAAAAAAVAADAADAAAAAAAASADGDAAVAKSGAVGGSGAKSRHVQASAESTSHIWKCRTAAERGPTSRAPRRGATCDVVIRLVFEVTKGVRAAPSGDDGVALAADAATAAAKAAATAVAGAVVGAMASFAAESAAGSRRRVALRLGCSVRRH